MTLERFHRPVSRRLDHIDRVVLCALLATSFITACLVVRSPRVPGRWKDDGIYLVTARALDRGEGYRLSHLPGEPYQTQYPVLYPLALSFVWRWFPEFPANLSCMQGLNALFAAAAWVGYRALRKAHLFPDWITGWGAVLTVANPWWVQMVRFTIGRTFLRVDFLGRAAVAGSRRQLRAVGSPAIKGVSQRHTSLSCVLPWTGLDPAVPAKPFPDSIVAGGLAGLPDGCAAQPLNREAAVRTLDGPGSPLLASLGLHRALSPID